MRRRDAAWIAIGALALLCGLVVADRLRRPASAPPDPALAAPVLPAATPPEPAAAPPPPREEPRDTAPSAEPAAPARPTPGVAPSPSPAAVAATPPVVSAPAPQPSSQAAAPRALPAPVTPTPAAPAPASPPAPVLPREPTAKAVEPPPAPPDDPDSDRRLPTLQFLRFEPAEIPDGGTSTLSIGTSDDLSGVKSVFGTVRSPGEAAVVTFAGEETGGQGTFSARVTIPRQAETGGWYVATLQIVDRAGNWLNLAYNRTSVPAGGTLRVVSESSDSAPPVIHSLAVRDATLDAGQMNKLIVSVEDEGSGVASVTGSIQSPSRSALVPFSCQANVEAGTWEADLPIPANADCGAWTVAHVRAADKANNTVVLAAGTPVVDAVKFVVSGGGACDAEPPLVDSVTLSPTVVSNTVATEVVVTVVAHDAASGVGSLSGRIDGPVAANGQFPRVFFAAEPNPSRPDAPLTATVAVPPFAAKGTWKVTVIQILDKARNLRTYRDTDAPLAGASFEVR